MHSFSTRPNLRHHTTVLNADVRNCYTTLKVVICSKLSNDLVSTHQSKMWFIYQNYKFVQQLGSKLFKIVRICARSGRHVHGRKRLHDDATENVKPHLQLRIFFGVFEFAASQLYVTVQG